MGNNVLLLVAGDSTSDQLTVENDVWFAPRVSTSFDLAQYYRAADMYVHATHVETFGLTIVEAMASSLPVIATRTAAIPEVVTDGVSGHLTSPGDVDEMTARVVELVRDEEKRQAMGTRAKEAAQRFSVDRTIDAYLNWYAEIVEQVAISA
jgi:glycosyltransferase involved in cell wall biosynthesis